MRRHSLAPITTRRYHPGRHGVAMQVNGRIVARATFHLRAPGQRTPKRFPDS